MELRLLRYFIAVAEELHFGQAAARLNMSQPPLSQQIRQLEEELGFQLLYRSKHHVELTEAGKVFLEEARKTFVQIEQARDLAEKAHQGASGSMRIALLGSTTYVVAPLLRSFCTRYPKVDVAVHHMKTSEQLQALHERRIHIGVTRTPVHSPVFHSLVYQTEPLVAALHETHRLAGQDQLHAQDLAEEPLLLPQRRHAPSYYNAATALCYEAGFSPNIAFELPEVITMLAFVSEGMGTALIPSSFRHYASKRIVYRDLHDSAAALQTCFVWRKDDQSPTLREFLRLSQPSAHPDILVDGTGNG